MPHVLVRYRVKPDRVAENEELVRAVYDELTASQPGGLQYATVKLPDGVTFIHIAEHGEPNPLQQTAAFPRFLDGINDRCDEPPAVSQVDVIGSYHFFETGQ